MQLIEKKGITLIGILEARREDLVIHRVDTRPSFIHRAFLQIYDELEALLGRSKRRIDKSKDDSGNDEQARCLLQNDSDVSIRGPFATDGLPPSCSNFVQPKCNK